MLVNYFGPRPVALTADAFTNGQSGMQAGQAQVNQASSEIARAPLYQQEAQQRLQGTDNSGTDAQGVVDNNAKATDATGLRPSSMTRELINLHEGELVFKANARSIEAAQSMFANLMNIGRDSVTEGSREQGGV